MLTPLIQNNLEFPQPSIILDDDTIVLRLKGDEVGDIHIRGLIDITIDDSRFEVQAIPTQIGFYDGVLKLLDDVFINSPEVFNITISGTTLLNNSEYSVTFSINPISQRIPTSPIFPTKPETQERYEYRSDVPPLSINIHWQLEILPSNKIMVPGCEPTSALSSVKLSSWLAASGCKNVLVNVSDVLEAIPGSYLKYGNNFGRGGMRQRWLVLPPIDPDCPCSEYPDYYRILRELASEEAPVEETYDACNISGMGYCPSPDFVEPPPDDPYQEEGTFPVGGGVLPPIPPWGQSGT